MHRVIALAFALLLGSEAAAFGQSDFKVTLLGTASPQARTNRFGPSTLVEAGGQVLLFDAGRGVPIRMGQVKIPIGKIDVLFLPHFHSDHGDVIKPAYGYRIDYKGHSAVISGDTRYNANVIKYGTGVDLLIHEVAIARPELMSNLFAQAIIAHHTSPHDSGRVFTQAKAKLAAYTHLVFLSNEKVPEATLDDLVKQTRETYQGPLEVGEDLTSFEIGDTVTVTRWKQ